MARGTAGKQDYGTDGRLYRFRQDIQWYQVAGVHRQRDCARTYRVSFGYHPQHHEAGGRDDPPHPLFRLSGHDRERAFLAHHHRLVRLARRGAGRQRHEMRGKCDRQPDCKRWIGRREALH